MMREKTTAKKAFVYFIIIPFILIGLILYDVGKSYFSEYKEITSSDLQTITDVITNKAVIEKNGKSSRLINIKVKSYPTFNFHIQGNNFIATNSTLYTDNVTIGDTLIIDILKDDYEMKITKEKPLGFLDKTINYSIINVYGLRDKKYTYLSLSDYNAQSKRDKSLSIWVLLLFLASIFTPKITFRKKYKQNKNQRSKKKTTNFYQYIWY